MTMCGPKELKFLLVLVYNVNNANERVYVCLWYRPPDNMAALDDLCFVLESLDISVFSRFVHLGDFISIFITNSIHSFVNYPQVYTTLF